MKGMPSSIRYSEERFKGLMPEAQSTAIANVLGDWVLLADQIATAVLALNLAGFRGSSAVRLAIAGAIQSANRHPLKVNQYADSDSRRRDSERAHQHSLTVADMALLLDNPILQMAIKEAA